MANDTKEGKKESTGGSDRRVQISQSDVPSMSLDQALRVPKVMGEQYGGGTVSPLQLAAGLNISPTSGPFRMMCGASIAYGLTEGGYNAKEIALTPLGRRIVKPMEENDDMVAKREATLKPRVPGEFLRKYDGSPLPRVDIARNVLETMKVPSSRSESVFDLIVSSAKSVGFIREIKGKLYVDLDGTAQVQTVADQNDSDPSPETVEIPAIDDLAPTPAPSHMTPVVPAIIQSDDDERRKRVFITHGKNKELIEPIKRLLEFGELVPVISVQRETVSKSVPDKVMDDMRSCGAAIIHVADEARLSDEAGNVRVVLNENVLIEIGAAMALYKTRFILLVKKGLELPSNLQGLYRVEYEGDTLDVHGTIRLMEAINNLKTHGQPPTTEAAAG
jgi:hypothetical protein